MPQLNPAPWLFVLTFVWITLLTITLKVIHLRLPYSKARLHFSTKPPVLKTSWGWPWH